ncbi:MAG: protease inhibitor I42 family protein [Spirochaetes bacterium]|nr:protease inhibitor I42 family protein [Spirochaetota bacterium]
MLLFFLFNCTQNEVDDDKKEKNNEQEKYNYFINNATKLNMDQTTDILNNGICYINLEGSGSTGYWWYYNIDDETKIMLYDMQTFDFNQSDTVGGHIMGVWKFKGIATGETKITFKYYRSWEGEETAIDTRVYSVNIN